MDIILHKLTEDILCLSQMATTTTTATSTTAIQRQPPDAQQTAAIRRVRRLTDFQREHPECSLVENPMSVQTLMSRADIAETLRTCLRDVTTASGIPVGSPAYAVLGRQPLPNSPFSSSSSSSSSWMEEQVAPLSFPIIVKPLVAAGTKASHAMAVLLDRSALRAVAEKKAPCLCQEYSNHDAVLYKVYVLGDHVSVHKRRSLPNLPSRSSSSRSWVEFDSQRPYPRLTEFGFDDEEEEVAGDAAVDATAAATTTTNKDDYHRAFSARVQRKRSRVVEDDSSSSNRQPVSVTTEEVQPIVDALKEAFGLELFGFDILVTTTTPRRMLVVDVNYFPSYKEVANFPALLAKYLTDRAIENRRRTAASLSLTVRHR